MLERTLFRLASLWLASIRVRIVGRDAIWPLLEPGHPVIDVTWHCNVLYAPFHHRGRGLAVMVSGSADGEWMAKYVRTCGHQPFRGSRHKGGIKAVMDMAEVMKARACGAGMIADGSRGPALVAQKGPVVLARETGIPLLPTGFAARPAQRLNSWDRTVLPYPWARAVVVYGTPIQVPQNARGPEVERLRVALEKGLKEADHRAEELLSAC
jgi:lysophospholipid acyltransferase (LPLAT)-like uncharacterized protein